MKQILQNLKSGATEIVEVPVPAAERGQVLIRTSRTLVSAGTERMLVDFGRAGWLEKAREQPEKVKQVLDKIRTDGLMPTIEAVRSKLNQPLALGYCNSGIIQELGDSGIEGLKVGARVVSNGPHAEVVCVPNNLCVLVPDKVSDEEAAFTVVGAIALQGIRLAVPTLGECFVVIGLGLIGLLTVQILRANGCKVLGVELDTAKCELAREFGAETADLSKGEDSVEAAMAFSRDRGVDGVLITAATKSSEPVHQAAQMCRKRGRIVLVGVSGLELNRADFYEKELSFQVSCSYGPGRYDPEYEEKGHDYPIGYVRWTEQRNFKAVLNLMASGKIDVKPLITHRFPFEEATKAYDLIAENKEPYLGIIFEYGRTQSAQVKYAPHLTGQAESKMDSEKESTITLRTAPCTMRHAPTTPVVGLIGAGNFTGQVLLPALKKTGVRLKTIASSGGVSGTHLGKKFGFEESTTDVERILSDMEINTVFITTRHNTHAHFVQEALKAGKHVFVEKPLCLNKGELSQIKDTYHSLITNNDSQITSNGMPLLMVGFNRRFAPHIVKMKELLTAVKGPKSMIMTVNAGLVPADHWTQDLEIGGGRIVGEVCHFVDLLRFLAGSEIVSSEISQLESGVEDTVSIQLSFGDGSIGTIHYFANGNKSFPKERLEIFCMGKILQLDNFKVLRGYGWKGFRKMRLLRQDKGHAAEVKAFAEAIESGGVSPIEFDEIVEVARVSLELAKRQFLEKYEDQ